MKTQKGSAVLEDEMYEVQNVMEYFGKTQEKSQAGTLTGSLTNEELCIRGDTVRTLRKSNAEMTVQQLNEALMDDYGNGKKKLVVDRKNVLRGIVIGMLIIFYGFLAFMMFI
jgi:hypothetical protein